MAQPPISEDEARVLFARQLSDLRAEGPAPDSEARLAAIFAEHERDCRELEARLAEDPPPAAALPAR